MQSLFIIFHSLLYVILVLQASNQTPVRVSCLGWSVMRSGSGHPEEFMTDWMEKICFQEFSGEKFIKEAESYESASSNEQQIGANISDPL